MTSIEITIDAGVPRKVRAVTLEIVVNEYARTSSMLPCVSNSDCRT